MIATHSPHVVADIKSEQLRVIRKDENGVSIVPNEQIEETYFQTSESILKYTMGLENTRSDEGQEKFNKLKTLLKQDLYDNEEFIDIYNYLKSYLGEFDKDLIAIDMEKARRKRKKEREDAKGR